MFTAMSAYRCIILFLQFIFIAVCFSEITNDQKDRYLSGFVDFLNNIPNKPYVYENGVLINVKEDDPNTYKIEINVKATDIADTSKIKYVRCSCTITDDVGMTVDELVVVNNDYRCTDVLDDADSQFAVKLEEAVNDPLTSTETVHHQPVQLDNEVQSSDAATSGEQFIAVRREQPAPCIGCATHVDPAAEGVTELAELGVKHLDRHEPNIKHTLHTVNDVKRQVQVVNGVRYILILTVRYNNDNCTTTENQDCTFKKICKITILEKPWMKLPSGSKYRAILANNCTENWLFGDNGEIINLDENKENDQVNKNSDNSANTQDKDQIVKVMHNSELTSGQNEHKFMSEELKNIQEQIIPLNEFGKKHGGNNVDLYNKNTDANIKYTFGLDTAISQKKSDSPQTYKEENNHNSGSINEEKKKVIDDLMNFFNFAGFDPKPEDTDSIPRMKRSFDSDLLVMSLQEKFYKLKSHLTNAKQLYELGQVLVDYLNEMDMEVKTRALNDILAAEEEYEGHQNFYYIKARVNIPCEKAVCSTNDTESKICNGVLDNSNPKTPQVLTAFCYKDDAKNTRIGVAKDIPLDDPILRKFVNEAVKKIENELSNLKALKPTKILNANTQRLSGTLTKISMILEFTDCNVTVPIVLRDNCTILDNLGSKICNVEVHERYWIKEKKLTYTCNDRPIDVSFSELNVHSQKKMENVDDPIAKEIAQDALQYLETESNVNKRQTILKIKSVTTQIVAGVLTEVEFIVGYTDCDYNLKHSIYIIDKSIKDCKLLENQPLRLCRARVWERPWLQDDKQFNVSCAIESSDHDNIRNEKPLELDTPQQRNPNDLKYYKLAEKSLKRYLLLKKIKHHHKILKIEEVTTQHVSGALTKIKFVVSPTNCLIDPNGMVSPSMNCVASSMKVRCIAEIVERPRLDSTLMQQNCTEITKGIITSNQRKRRDVTLVGAPKTLNPNDDQYKKLADECLKKYMTNSGITQPHKVCSIVKFTTQVVAGKLTKLEFLISPSNCEIDRNGELMAQDCEIQTNNNCHIICHAEVWDRIWLKKKDISVECKDNNKSRVKRHVRNEPVEKDASDPKYKFLAEKAIKEYLKDQRIDRIHEVVNVAYVSSQQKRDEILQLYFQIAPTNCKLKSRSKGREKCKVDMSSTIDCHAEVRIKTYQPKNQYKVDCNKLGHVKLSNKIKRSTVVSWPSKADDQYNRENNVSYVSPESIINTEETKQLEDKDDPSIKEYVEWTLQKYFASNQNKQHYKVSDITLVNSFKSFNKNTDFELLYDITPTNCTYLKSDQTNYSDCKVTDPSNLFSCVSEISVDRTGGKNYKSTDCNIDTRDKVQKLKLGNNDDNEKFNQWAHQSLNKYLKEARIQAQYVLRSVKSIESTGRIYKIEFVISPTDCLPGPKCELSFNDCKIDNTKNVTCYSQVLNDKVLEVACEGHSNTKLSLNSAGGKIERNASDPKFKVSAQTALRVFIHKNNIPKYLVVTKVLSVTTQVLSGVLTDMKFEMSPTNCKSVPDNPLDCKPDTSQSFTCDSSVLQKPWAQIEFVSDISCTGDWESRAKSSVKQEAWDDEPRDRNDPEYKVNENKIKPPIFSGAKEMDPNDPKYFPMPGGETEQDPNDPKYKLLAEESLKQYLKISDISENHKVTRVNKVLTQIVSGTLTTIEFEASSTDSQNRRRRQLRSACKTFKCFSKIWEQPWLNKKDITVNCNMTNQKGPKAKLSGEIHITGGGMVQDPNRPEYKVLAEKSLQKYQEESGVSQNYRIVRMISVITQVVSGMLTKINFEASPTNCQNNADSNCEVINCTSRVWDQAWLNKEDISVNCGGLKQKGLQSVNVGASQGIGPTIGGLTKKDPNDPKYKTLAEESLQKYLNTVGETRSYKVARVNSVLSQVVSGIRTVIEFEATPSDCHNRYKRQLKTNCEIMKCSSDIWEQEWMNKKDISVNCGGLKEKVLKLSKLSGGGANNFPMPGGETEQDPNNPKYKILAEESLQKYLNTVGETRSYKVARVNSVLTQVVSGFRTVIEFEATPAGCENRHKRQFKTNCEVMKCSSDIWEQEWLNKKDISVNCGGLKQKEPQSVNVGAALGTEIILGGRTEEDPNDPTFKLLAEHALQKYLKNSQTPQNYTVVKVNKVFTQVVSGILTIIEFAVSPINCQDCKVSKCESNTLDVQWLNKTDITVNCNLNEKNGEKQKVLKLTSVGSLTKEDPNDPEYKTLAEESLQKYLNTVGETRSYKVARVNSVLSQVVSGIRTVIEFEATPSDCHNRYKRQSKTNCEIMKCSSDIWEQEWLNKKDISVNCGGLKQKGLKLSKVSGGGAKHIPMPGGETEQDPNNPKYKILAEESLQKYLNTVGETISYKVARVNSVLTQVVSGFRTVIEFEATPAGCENRHKRQSKTNCEVMKCSSEIWEQASSNKKDISVNCGGLKQKEPQSVNVGAALGTEIILGGRTEEDPNDPTFKLLAEHALQKYLKNSQTPQNYTVVKVNKVFTQVVSGILTIIEFAVSPINCQDCKVSKCESNTLDVQWLNKTDITVNCNLNEKNGEKQKVLKLTSVGGLTKEDPNDPKYKTLAEESLQKYLNTVGDTRSYKVARVNSVLSQVVSGIRTVIEFEATPSGCDNRYKRQSKTNCETMQCSSDIWEQEWLNKKDISVNCGGLKQKGLKLSGGGAKHFPMPGGETEQDPNNPKYKILAEESLQKYLNTVGETRSYKVARINSVLTQVVSGFRNVIEFEATPAGCENRHKRQSKTNCEVMKCSSEIWEQVSSNKKDISVNCGGLKQKGLKLSGGGAKHFPMPGGETEQDPNDPKYKILAEESLKQYLKISGISENHKVTRVNKVLTQVVSGTLTTIEFEASSTDSQNRRRRQLRSACKTFKCFSKIWEQPWLNKKDITVNCNMTNQKGPKAKLSGEIHITGGGMVQDPNRPEYKVLAEKSLHKYQEDAGISQNYKVVRMISVITRVVSGIITIIDFEASPTNCQNRVRSNSRTDCEILRCHSRIWEQEWLDRKTIYVNCSHIEQRSRVKRELSDLSNNNVVENPVFLALANKSLESYVKQSGATQQYKVKQLTNVITQVVSGYKTKLYFEAVPIKCGVDVKNSSEALRCKSADSNIVLNCHSEILERPWKNKTDVTVECINPKPYLSTRGTPYAEANNPQYKALAEESLQQYLQYSGITRHHQVTRINDVSVQLVSGVITRIEFDVSPTNCSLDSHGKTTSPKCQVTNSSNKFQCKSEIREQSWLHRQEISVKCLIPSISDVKSPGIKGDRVVQNPEDPKYRVLAEKSLKVYLKSIKNMQYQLIRVTDVITQIVAGLKTKISFYISPTNCKVNSSGKAQVGTVCRLINPDYISSCFSEIWERPWLQNRIISVDCFAPKISETIMNELANASLRQYLRTSSKSKHFVMRRIINVINEGTHLPTEVNFEISPTNCSVHKVNANCKATNEIFTCHSKIKDQIALNKNNINVTCIKSQRVKREVLERGQIDQSITDNKFKALAEKSMQKYLENSSDRHIFNVIEIIRASTEVVSGSFTSLDFKISSTNCSFDAHDKSNCIENHLKVFLCHSDIWERPWINDDANIISVECRNSDDLSLLLNEDSKLNDVNHKIERLIRSLNSPLRSGAPQEQDANLPKFRKLAKEALDSYFEKKHIAEQHEVVKVNKVIQKVASGFIFKINFIALPRTCYKNVSCSKQETLMLKCNTVIWDRPWLKRKDIKVACRRQEATEQQISPENKSVSLMKESYVRVNDSKKNVHTGEEYQEVKDKNTKKYKDLAQQALWKYERTSISAYMYKVTKVHHVSERVLAGIVTNIEFSALLTDCQLNGNQRVDAHCKIQEPNIGIRCKAEISRLIPNLDETIEVKCKNKRFKNFALSTTESNSDHVVITRGRRQIPPDDDYIEEEVKFYYAERALSDYNRRSGTNNLHKIVTIHDTQRSYHMKTLMYRIYLEIAMTYCMRHGEENEVPNCDEIEGINHKLCLARVYPSPDDEMIIRHVTMVCDDDTDFQSVTGLSVTKLVKESIAHIEKSPDVYYKLAHQGEANIVPSLDYTLPIRLSFLVATTNCSKDYDSSTSLDHCWVDANVPTKICTSYIYMTPNTRNIHHIDASCRNPTARTRRSISTNSENATTDDLIIQQMVQEAIEKLEMSSLQRYKQRVLLINSFSTKITTGKETTIDFDVGYTNCLKFEWVENITSCEFIEHLPRRHCVAKVFERLWVKNGRSIDVSCEDDETPLEAHIEFESAENAMHLAREALKHIEAKYPSPYKQKVVRIFSLEKQTIAGLHYRMKIEVGYTDCVALSVEENCKLVSDPVSNKFCRVNVWVRPWTDHPPSYRVTCDYQDGLTTDVYHQIQAEHLFYDFLTKHKPDYINDYAELRNRYHIFSDNIKKIHELNIYERGTARYAVTRFADMTYEEFGQKYLGLKLSLRNSNRTNPLAEIPRIDLPDKFDWRDFDAVTEVKDQGACGSCWAFSVTGNIEGQWKMQSGQLVSLSEQELVDCDTLDHGCNGGLPDNAYRAIEQLGGLEAETDYPYDGANDNCSFNKTLSKVQISGAVNISSNETDMAKWLVQNGPISIGINANAMQFYVGGISHPWKMLCNANNLDHGVLIVGYGIKDYPLFHKRLPYWIIKNSWGDRWGEQGYYRVYRGDGTCGVNKMASSAVI